MMMETLTGSGDNNQHHRYQHLIKNKAYSLQPRFLPIVYHRKQDITAPFGLHRLHPFDSSKWGRVVAALKAKAIFPENWQPLEPVEVTNDDLKLVHSDEYLAEIQSSSNVAKIVEIPFLAYLPNFILQRWLLRPLRLQTGGTVLACHLARKYGWAINIGGGFHHASREQGGGFCVYADIQLGIKYLLDTNNDEKVLIIDVDAHQGNGYERDFSPAAYYRRNNMSILDAYNPYIYPNDRYAKRSMSYPILMETGIKDEAYLRKLNSGLDRALNEFKPTFIFYNAGSDILSDDPLGLMLVSPQGIAKRDVLVFKAARSRNIPIVMVTSGGYHRTSAQVIADSIENLWKTKHLELQPEDFDIEKNPSLFQEVSGIKKNKFEK